MPHRVKTARKSMVQCMFLRARCCRVLAKVGAPAWQAIRGVELVDIVIVEARDGYKVALDLAGYAAMRTDRVILADRVDGSICGRRQGPFQSSSREICALRAPSAWFRRSISNACGERREDRETHARARCRILSVLDANLKNVQVDFLLLSLALLSFR